MTTNTQTSLKLGNRLTALTELLVVDQLIGLCLLYTSDAADE